MTLYILLTALLGQLFILITVVHGNLEMFFNCVLLPSMSLSLIFTGMIFEVLVCLSLGAFTQMLSMNYSLYINNFSLLKVFIQ